MLNTAMTVAVNDFTTGPQYLGRLNAEQRRAVMHGDGKVAAPLLVIAGAGSGKTIRWRIGWPI